MSESMLPSFLLRRLATQGDSPYIQGLPLLAVEILSPGDKQSAINDKVSRISATLVYHMVWVIDPAFRTRRCSSTSDDSSDVRGTNQ